MKSVGYFKQTKLVLQFFGKLSQYMFLLTKNILNNVKLLFKLMCLVNYFKTDFILYLSANCHLSYRINL